MQCAYVSPKAVGAYPTIPTLNCESEKTYERTIKRNKITN